MKAFRLTYPDGSFRIDSRWENELQAWGSTWYSVQPTTPEEKERLGQMSKNDPCGYRVDQIEITESKP